MKTQPNKLSKHEIKYLGGSKYRPQIPEKYFFENGVEYINSAVPTKYMTLQGEPKNKPKVILDLFHNLLNNNTEYVEYFLNWLAYNFQGGIKPKVAIILFGLEGTGKNILYYIMQKLYGSENCSQLNPASFNSRYDLITHLENKRFINLDEMTMDISDKKESFFKQLIANPEITLGKKIEVHAQCLFTANYSTVFRISSSDRRYTVFGTGMPLTSNDFLGFGSYEILEKRIHDEMDDFAKYLNNYPVDAILLREPLMTPEKHSIISISQDRFLQFYKALITLNIGYFSQLDNLDFYLSFNIKGDFKVNRINRKYIAPAYNLLFGDDLTTVTIMKMLREVDTKGIFYDTNPSHSGNDHYFYPKGKQK